NSPDVMRNSHDVVLRDVKRRKSTGIHNDFLQLVPGLIVDTHCAQRARLGRLMAVQAKAIEDYQDKKIISICLEERTALVIKKNRAEVFGTGIAHFLQETENTKVIRQVGTPLVYTDIRDDALTHGWIYDLDKRSPDLSHIPTSTVTLPPYATKQEKIKPFSVFSYPVKPLRMIMPSGVKDLYVITDAFSELKLTNGLKKLSTNHTNGLSLIYRNPGGSVAFVDAGIVLEGNENGEVTSKKANANSHAQETASLILDCSECSYKSLSPFISNQDYKGKSLHSPGLINMRLHLIDSRATYNIQTRRTRILEIPPPVRTMASKKK
ncbi:MAG: hypothetical protein K2Q18_19460, partial [Bdellovibrionales bacterium]|nr:hypothetical protein [Bdellovibrionales bacterium]